MSMPPLLLTEVEEKLALMKLQACSNASMMDTILQQNINKCTVMSKNSHLVP